MNTDVLLRKIKEIEDKLNIINSTIGEIEMNIKDSANDIDYGCRVLYTYDNGESGEGRVVHKVNSYSAIPINRDGYKSYMNFEISSLKNLSVGTYGRLEKEQWILTQQYNELLLALKSSDINYIELELIISRGESNVNVEIINNVKIENIDAHIISLRRLDSRKLIKFITSNQKIINLSLGKYNFQFMHNVLIGIQNI